MRRATAASWSVWLPIISSLAPGYGPSSRIRRVARTVKRSVGQRLPSHGAPGAMTMIGRPSVRMSLRKAWTPASRVSEMRSSGPASPANCSFSRNCAKGPAGLSRSRIKRVLDRRNGASQPTIGSRPISTNRPQVWRDRRQPSLSPARLSHGPSKTCRSSTQSSSWYNSAALFPVTTVMWACGISVLRRRITPLIDKAFAGSHSARMRIGKAAFMLHT